MNSKDVIKELNELIHDSPVRIPVEFMTGLKNALQCIEDMEEHIAIMSEGGWHKITESTDSLPKETESVDVWVYGENENGKPIVFRAIYLRWHFYDVSGRLIRECEITHWMYNKEPEPPKEGEE